MPLPVESPKFRSSVFSLQSLSFIEVRFGSEKKFWPEKNFWYENNFWSKNNFGPGKILAGKFFWLKIILGGDLKHFCLFVFPLRVLAGWVRTINGIPSQLTQPKAHVMCVKFQTSRTPPSDRFWWGFWFFFLFFL